MSSCANCSSKLVLFACGGPCQGAVQYCSRTCGKEHFAEHAGECLLIEGKRDFEDMSTASEEPEASKKSKQRLLTYEEMLAIHTAAMETFSKRFTDWKTQKQEFLDLLSAQRPGGVTTELWRDSFTRLREENLEKAQLLRKLFVDSQLSAQQKNTAVIIDTMKRVRIDDIRKGRETPALYSSIAGILEIFGYSFTPAQVATVLQELQLSLVKHGNKPLNPNSLLYIYKKAQDEIDQAMVIPRSMPKASNAPLPETRDEIFDMICAHYIERWREGKFEGDQRIKWKNVIRMFKTLLRRREVSKESQLQTKWATSKKEVKDRLVAWLAENKPKYEAAYALMNL